MGVGHRIQKTLTMRTTVLLNRKQSAPTIARKPRKLQLELIASEQPLDHAALQRAAVPFLVTILRRWQSEQRVIVVNGILRVNPNYNRK